MSTLVTQTISNGTVSTSSTNVIQGSAKAWVNFNGTGTVAIRASYNVSSITDNGTGLYTVNFTNALPDANYSAVASTRRNNGSAGENNSNVGVTFRGASAYSTAFTTTAVQVCVTIVSNEAAYDSDFISVSIFD
jgi:hypothetical protein